MDDRSSREYRRAAPGEGHAGAERREQELLARFRLRMARAASRIALIVIAACSFSVFVQPVHTDHAPREVLWALLAAAAAVSVAIHRRSRPEATPLPLWAFYVWTLGVLAFDSAVVYLFGDASSDVYLVYLLAVLFAAATLPAWGAALALTAAVAAYLWIVLTLDGEIRQAELVLRAATFAVVGLLGGYLAREQQREIAVRVDQEERLRERGRELERERERAEVLAAEMQTMLDILAEGVVAVDAGERVVYLNPAAERLLGRASDEVVGRPCAEVLDAVDEAGRAVAWGESAICRSDAETGVRVRVLQGDRGRVLCEVSGADRLDASDRVVGHLYTLRDVRREEDQRQEVVRKNRDLSELLATAISAQEGERGRIARELHDGAIQALSAVSMQLGLVEEMGPHQYALSQPRIGAARVALGRTLAEIRLMMQNLRPSALDDLGLVTALHDFAAAQCGAAGVRLRWEVSGRTRRLPPPVETAVFRILQEGVNNVVRHARARSALVSISFDDGHLCASVEDDGVGFDPVQVRRRSHGGGVGLLGMHERAALLGGTVAIESAPDAGTRLRVRIPVGAPVDD